MDALEQWEMAYLEGATTEMSKLIGKANVLASMGWEPVGIASADKTLGFNSNVLVFKRRISSPPPPPASDDEWQPDPTGRFDLRRWDGRVWTAQTAMTEKKTQHVDPPWA